MFHLQEISTSMTFISIWSNLVIRQFLLSQSMSLWTYRMLILPFKQKMPIVRLLRNKSLSKHNSPINKFQNLSKFNKNLRVNQSKLFKSILNKVFSKKEMKKLLFKLSSISPFRNKQLRKRHQFNQQSKSKQSLKIRAREFKYRMPIKKKMSILFLFLMSKISLSNKNKLLLVKDKFQP